MCLLLERILSFPSLQGSYLAPAAALAPAPAPALADAPALAPDLALAAVLALAPEPLRKSVVKVQGPGWFQEAYPESLLVLGLCLMKGVTLTLQVPTVWGPGGSSTL